VTLYNALSGISFGVQASPFLLLDDGDRTIAFDPVTTVVENSRRIHRELDHDALSESVLLFSLHAFRRKDLFVSFKPVKKVLSAQAT